ncbi:MAG TPA: phosphoserine phosphatase [Roseburia sp.]|nr:phosphoserine phosphatase [Roseburia sp.]
MNVYDFDKTIYKKDCSIQFYLFAIKKNPQIIFKCLFKQILAIIEYKRDKIDKKEMKKIYFCFLKYINTKEMLEEFIEKEIKNINGWYLEQKKKDDVIISASPEFLVKAFMGKLGITSVIASKVDIETGEFYGENCYGEEKVVRFQKMYGMTRVEKFYTDSVSDLPMAKRAEKAYLVRNGKVGDFLL